MLRDRMEPTRKLKRLIDGGSRPIERSLDDLESRLVWIFGSPRSGSTWLLRLLNSHREVVSLDETYLPASLVPSGLVSVKGEYWEHGDRADDPSFFFARRYLGELRPALRRLVLEQLGRQLQAVSGWGAWRWAVIKEPNGSHAADTMVSLLPGIRILLLLRDGRDIVDSQLDLLLTKNSWWQEAGKARVSARTLPRNRERVLSQQAHLWVARMNATQRALEALPEDRSLVVRYERLREDTAAELGRIFEWLALGTSEKQLAQIAASQDFDAIPSEERGPGRAFRAASPGLWRESMSREEQEVLDSIMGPKLRELGYASSTLARQSKRPQEVEILTDAQNGDGPSEEQLKQALDATSKRLRRFVAHVGETELDEQMSKEIRRSRRQLRENRQLLGSAPRRGSKGEKAGE
jgi:Sulfotransferase family